MAHCCVQILKPKQSVPLPIRSVHINLRLMKPTRQKCSTAYHNQNQGTRPPTATARATTREQWLLELSHTPPKILDSSSDLSHTHHQDGLVVPRSTWPENLVIIRGHTHSHAPPGYLAHHRTSKHAIMHLPHIEEQMLTPHDDVITPRQQHASTSTSALVHVSDTSFDDVNKKPR